MKNNIDKKKVLSVALISALLFTIFDYFGYNEANKKGLVDGKFINTYRIIQAIVQIGIAIACYFLGGWKAVISFTLIWWTWGCDWLFHLFCFTNFYQDRAYVTKTEEARKYWNESITWAWWTPVGLIKWLVTGEQTSVMKWDVLLFQSLLGIGVVIFINLI